VGNAAKKIRQIPAFLAITCDFRSGSKAPVSPSASHFQSTPNNGHRETAPACLKRATSDIVSYPITSSSLSSLDPADNRIVVYNHEAAISATIKLFTRNEAVANLAGDFPHRPA
jgi:hypothetical protein